MTDYISCFVSLPFIPPFQFYWKSNSCIKTVYQNTAFRTLYSPFYSPFQSKPHLFQLSGYPLTHNTYTCFGPASLFSPHLSVRLRNLAALTILNSKL